MKYLEPNMNLQEVNRLSMLGLAHVGDGVFELMTRSMLCQQGHTAVGQLHRMTVERVKAQAQARAAEKLLPLLTEEELALYKRGRNTHVHGVPHNADVGDYHAATGLEALFGWLFLQGKLARIEELFAAIEAG